MVADDSSIETGWSGTDVGPLGDGGRRRRGRAIEGTGRAQREDGAAGGEHGGQERGGQEGAAAGPLARRDGTALAGTGVGAGSYQRSGVTGGVSSQDRAQSLRGSGLGAKRSRAGSDGAVVPVEGAHGSTEALSGVVGVADGQVGPVEAGFSGVAGLAWRLGRLGGRVGGGGVTLGQVAGIGAGAGFVVHGGGESPRWSAGERPRSVWCVSGCRFRVDLRALGR